MMDRISAADLIQIDLPWPSKNLSPNARVHWGTRDRSTRAARQAAALVSSAWGPIDADRLNVTVTASPPKNIRFDDDNFIARCKAYFDGVADSLGVNDRAFRIMPLRRGEVVKGGNVRIEIEVAE